MRPQPCLCYPFGFTQDKSERVKSKLSLRLESSEESRYDMKQGDTSLESLHH